MLERRPKDVTLTEEQLDDLLKQWKKKGAERALTFTILGSIPLAVVGAFAFVDMAPSAILTSCAIYYCSIVFLAKATQ